MSPPNSNNQESAVKNHPNDPPSRDPPPNKLSSDKPVPPDLSPPHDPPTQELPPPDVLPQSAQAAFQQNLTASASDKQLHVGNNNGADCVAYENFRFGGFFPR